VIFGFFAILNLANLVAIVPSVLWLSFVTCIVSTRSPEAGGNIQVCPKREQIEVFAGRRSVLHSSEESHLR
jgi:hypothetical protein